MRFFDLPNDGVVNAKIIVYNTISKSPRMRCQSMSGLLSLGSSDNLLAASPIISKFLITASTVLLSDTNSSKDRNAV